MAFGKNPANNNSVPFGGSVQQRAAAATRREKRPGGGSGGGGTPYYLDNYKPTTMGEDLIRIHSGDYTRTKIANDGTLYTEQIPWFECVEHYFAGQVKRGAICSAGPFRMQKGKREECYGCTMFWEDWEIRDQHKKTTGQGTRNPNRVSMKDQYVFNVTHLAPYYKTEALDATGQIKMNTSTGQPYTQWKELKNPNDPLAHGKEQKHGHTMAWTLGRDHFDALNAYGAYVGKCCLTCGNRDCIDWSMWLCGNPECGIPIIRKSDTTLNLEQIAQMTSGLYTCQQCRISAYLQEVVSCSHCAQVQQMPQRATIFDVDIQVKRQGTNDSNKTQLIVPAYSNPKLIDAAYTGEAKKLVDLPTKFAPTPLDKQAKIWGYTPSKAQHAQAYTQ